MYELLLTARPGGVKLSEQGLGTPCSPWVLCQVGKEIGHRNEKLCPQKACLALKKTRLSVSVEKIYRHKTLPRNSVSMSPQPLWIAVESQTYSRPSKQRDAGIWLAIQPLSEEWPTERTGGDVGTAGKG